MIRKANTIAMLGLSVLTTGMALGQSVVRSTSVTVFNSTTAIPGASATLVRTSAGITGTVHTSELKAGAAYTVWVTIFNYPEKCSPPECNGDDVLPFPGNAAAGVSLVYGSGHVIGQNGKSNFAVHVKLGDTSGAMFGPGLLDPFKAVVHLVIRNHGQPIAGSVDDQISSFNGGCPPNTCANEQAAVFHAVSASDETTASLDKLQADLAKTKSLLSGLAKALGFFWLVSE